MSTAPVVSAPAAPAPAAPKLNKVESFFSKFGNVIKNIANVAANLGEQSEMTIDPLLPPAYQAGFLKLVNSAAAQVAAADAKYTIIGQANVPFTVKVAEAVAVGGEGVLAIAAQNNLAIVGNLNQFFSAASILASSINTSNLTAPPAPPAASPAVPVS